MASTTKQADVQPETQPEVDGEAVSTDRPDVPIVASLATGDGEHRPPDPSVYGPDGRAL